ncbi:hypothetical protein D3C71_2197810 [compost metagenome]
MQIGSLGKNRLAEVAEHGHPRAGKQPLEVGILERRVILNLIDKQMPHQRVCPHAFY